MPPDSLEDLQSIQSLRDILAKSAKTPTSPKSQTSPNDVEQSSPIPVNTSHTRSSSKSLVPNTPVLQYPTVNVPGSSPKSSTHTTPKTSPLKHGGSFFKSFRGRSPFDADEDEFGHGRKYSTTTLKTESKLIAAVIMPGTPSRSAAQAQAGPVDVGASGQSSSVTLRGGSWVPAVATTRTDDNNIDDGQDTVPVCKKQDVAPTAPLLTPTNLTSPRLHSPYPLQSSSPASSIKLKDGNFFQSYRGHSPLNASPTTALSTSPTTPTPRVRSISWADQTSPAPSEPPSEKAALGSKDDDDKTSSTLSLSSNSSHTPPAHLDGSKTIRAPQGKIMSSTLAIARDISPHKGSLWDPDDDEWAEVDDANKLVETFKASYRSPAARSPVKTSALSYFQDTIKSVLLSPTKKAAEEKLRHDERVQDQVDELRNTYYCDPNGDLHDEVMESVFVRDPLGHFGGMRAPRTMHVIDLDAYFLPDDPLVHEARPRLCDAVATILSHTSKECLEAFLDPSIEHFTYRREVDRSKGGLMLIVRREGNEVVCGAYVNFGFMLQWKLYVKSKISITGQWHEVYATTKPGLMRIDNGTPEWGVIRSDAPENKGEEIDGQLGNALSRKLELSPKKKKVVVSEDVSETNPKFMLYQSRTVARLLLWDIWYLFDKMYDCRATWEADGEEVEMRLKRELVGSGDDDED